MKARTVGIKLGLGALVLGVWVAVQAAAPVITNLTMVGTTPHFSIQSDLGITNQIQYCNDLSLTNWTVLTNLAVTQSPYWFSDTSPLPGPHRFFRVLAINQASGSTPTNMVWIPPGTFVMGSPANEAERYDDERQHTVTLTKGFYMGKYEVTQGQYLTVVGSNPSYFVTNNGYVEDLNRPVERVSWNDATNYCVLLTQLDRMAQRIPATWGYRLPTEAEWEYACRAGTTNAFHFGTAIHGGMANFYSYYEYDAAIGYVYVVNPVGYLTQTTTVGSYAPNAFGLCDMHGNVWEWCRDWYGTYPGGSVIDPQGPATGPPDHVRRGGSWNSDGVYCRSACRLNYIPTITNGSIGFRVVLAPG